MDYAKLLDELDGLCPLPWKRTIARPKRYMHLEMEDWEEKYYRVKEAIDLLHEMLLHIKYGLQSNEPSPDQLIRINEIKQTAINSVKQVHEWLSKHASIGEEIKKKLNEAVQSESGHKDLITSLYEEKQAHEDVFFWSTFWGTKKFISRLERILKEHTE